MLRVARERTCFRIAHRATVGVMRTSSRSVFLLAALGVAALGCGARSTTPGADASTRVDASTPVDAGDPNPCDGCRIGGVCVAEGTQNPDNACEVCAPSVSATSFSPMDGAACDDGLFCTTDDVCSGSTCGGTARACSDGIDCNGEESCDEAGDACAPGTPTCAAGTMCEPSSDTCIATCDGCSVDGICRADGEINPANECEVCDPAASSTAWSANDGAGCDDGLFCTTGETCSSAACAGGAPLDCGDGVACNGLETCDETTAACLPGATTCASGETCDASMDACVPVCAAGETLCGAACVNTSTDPTNCGACGSACAASEICTSGTCSSGCSMVDDFETSVWPSAPWVAVSGTSGSVTAAAAHDGAFGLHDAYWHYRTDVATSVGMVLSTWVRANSLGGRYYMGFDATSAGAKSFVVAFNTNDIRFQDNPGYSYTELTTSPQTFVAGRWYRAELEIGPGGVATGRLFDSDGTTLLNTVTHTFAAIGTGGIAMQSFSDMDSDTIRLCP